MGEQAVIITSSLDEAKKGLSGVLIKGYADDITQVGRRFKTSFYHALERKLSESGQTYTQMRRSLNNYAVKTIAEDEKYRHYLKMFNMDLAICVNEAIQRVAEKQGALDC